ncbi:MAG: DUF971 domain-containing protein [Phycisphaerales bacterium]|nr:DUF971 domain-containing protein [Phycisphaerales bacterium]
MESAYPLAFDLDRSSGLRVSWSDGAEHVIPLAELRKNCPCATCRADREARAANPLHVMARPAGSSAQVAAAELVGSYALRLVWSDGHNTGIYEFEALRRLGEAAPHG